MLLFISVCTAALIVDQEPPVFTLKNKQSILCGKSLVPGGLDEQSSALNYECPGLWGMTDCSYFSSLLLSVCSLSVAQCASEQKKEKHVHKSNQTHTRLTINPAKHSRGAFNLSSVWTPLLSQHCSVKLQQQPSIDRQYWCCSITFSTVSHCSTWAGPALCLLTSEQDPVSGS